MILSGVLFIPGSWYSDRWGVRVPDFARRNPMTTTLSVPITIQAVVHAIEGGGYWAEILRFPGCVAQAETYESLQANLLRAIDDWLDETPEKTEEEARRLAAIQGTTRLADGSFTQPYEYQPSLELD
jgi:predicted RNase H-like HicB family nuclease